MEQRTLTIRGVPDRQVRDPFTKQPVQTDRTTTVPDTSFWRRRLRDKDIVAAGKKSGRGSARGEGGQ